MKQFITMKLLTLLLLKGKAILTSLAGTTIGGWCITLLLQLFLLFLPLYQGLIVVLVFVLMDTILGVLASIKNGGSFSSRKFRDGLLEKTTLYGILTLVFLLIENALKSVFGYGPFTICNIVLTLIYLYESGSIIEKLKKLNPNNQLFVRIAGLLERLQTRMEKKIEDDVDTLIEPEEN